jgi:hypothetical protein
LTAISEARINIEVEETPKIATTEVIPKILKEVHMEIIEVSLREEVIPKTLSNIILRDTRSITNQDIGPRTIQKKQQQENYKRFKNRSKTRYLNKKITY